MLVHERIAARGLADGAVLDLLRSGGRAEH